MKAIVTGGSAGIGLAIVQQLLEKDYEVVSVDIQPPGMKHPKLEHVELDLTNALATERFSERIKNQGITTLIHNAGTIRPAPLAEVKLQDLNALVNLHLSAALLLMQATLPAMKEAKYGRVVLISSRSVLGLPTRTAYAATKAGMLGMARTWALELAPHGITVNVVAPGPVQTANFHSIIPEGSPQVAKIAEAIPVKRLGQPQDVARAALFFADRDAGFVTGQVLYVCGGTSVGSLAL